MTGPENRPPEPSILHQMLIEVQREQRDQAIFNVKMETGLQRLEEGSKSHTQMIEQITRILRDGNGKPALLERMGMVEQGLASVKCAAEEVKQMIATSRVEDQKGKWSMASALATGLLALAASALTVLLTRLIGGVKP